MQEKLKKYMFLNAKEIPPFGHPFFTIYNPYIIYDFVL